MPLIHIYLKKGKSEDYIQTLGQTIHQTLMDTWLIPKHDCFQIFHEVEGNHLHINPVMWEMKRTDDVIVLHITSSPRTRAMKLAFYQELPSRLQKAIELKPDNVFISILTNQYEDWSFGQGQAQLLDPEHPQK